MCGQSFSMTSQFGIDEIYSVDTHGHGNFVTLNIQCHIHFAYQKRVFRKFDLPKHLCRSQVNIVQTLWYELNYFENRSNVFVFFLLHSVQIRIVRGLITAREPQTSGVLSVLDVVVWTDMILLIMHVRRIECFITIKPVLTLI